MENLVENHPLIQNTSTIKDVDKLTSKQHDDNNVNGAEDKGVGDTFVKSGDDCGVSYVADDFNTWKAYSGNTKLDAEGSGVYERDDIISDVFSGGYHGSRVYGSKNYVTSVVGCSEVTQVHAGITTVASDSNFFGHDESAYIDYGSNHNAVGDIADNSGCAREPTRFTVSYTSGVSNREIHHSKSGLMDDDICHGGDCSVKSDMRGKKRVNTAIEFDEPIYTFKNTSKVLAEKTDKKEREYIDNKKGKFSSFKNIYSTGKSHNKNIKKCIGTNENPTNQISTNDTENKLIRGTTNIFTMINYGTQQYFKKIQIISKRYQLLHIQMWLLFKHYSFK